MFIFSKHHIFQNTTQCCFSLYLEVSDGLHTGMNFIQTDLTCQKLSGAHTCVHTHMHTEANMLILYAFHDPK